MAVSAEFRVPVQRVSDHDVDVIVDQPRQGVELLIVVLEQVLPFVLEQPPPVQVLQVRAAVDGQARAVLGLYRAAEKGQNGFESHVHRLGQVFFQPVPFFDIVGERLAEVRHLLAVQDGQGLQVHRDLGFHLLSAGILPWKRQQAERQRAGRYPRPFPGFPV